MARLFTNESTATTSQLADSVTAQGDARTFSAYAWGTFDTATVEIQSSPDGGTTWFTEASFTAKGKSNFTVGAGVDIRGETTGVGASTSVNLEIH